jgi:GxxExxY protein
MEKIEFERIAREIVNAGYRVHQEIGPGLLESIYQFFMVEELMIRGIKTEQEVSLPVIYRGRKVEKAFRLDLLIENEIIVEIKAVEMLLPVHTAQIISYLKIADKRLGFLINSNVPVFKDGIHRYVNNY